MAYETAEGTTFLSYGELSALAKELDGPAAGIQAIFEGRRVSNDQAQGILGAARIDARSDRAKALIDTGLSRLRSAA